MWGRISGHERRIKVRSRQQDLDHAAAQRLRQFEEFITSTTERELRQFATASFAGAILLLPQYDLGSS